MDPAPPSWSFAAFPCHQVNARILCALLITAHTWDRQSKLD